MIVKIFAKKYKSMDCKLKIVARMRNNHFFCREYKCCMTEVLPVLSAEMHNIIRSEMEAHIVSQKFTCPTCQSLILGMRPMALAPSKACDDGSYITIEECVDLFCIPCRHQQIAAQTLTHIAAHPLLIAAHEQLTAQLAAQHT